MRRDESKGKEEGIDRRPCMQGEEEEDDEGEEGEFNTGKTRGR